MGLDQYATSLNRDPSRAPTDFDLDIATDGRCIHQWRNHHHLQAFMANLYTAKGGSAYGFNITPLELTLDDLDELEIAIRAGNFGAASDVYADVSYPERADDLEFIAKARAEYANGRVIAYHAWY